MSFYMNPQTLGVDVTETDFKNKYHRITKFYHLGMVSDKLLNGGGGLNLFHGANLAGVSEVDYLHHDSYGQLQPTLLLTKRFQLHFFNALTKAKAESA